MIVLLGRLVVTIVTTMDDGPGTEVIARCMMDDIVVVVTPSA